MKTLEDQEARQRIEASRRTYEEMLETAHKIHPEMRLRLVGIRQDLWEMYMPATFLDKKQLSGSYKGTFAWNLYQQDAQNYDNRLERYRQRNGLEGHPLEAAADHANLTDEEQVWVAPILAKLMEENDAVIDDWDEDIDNEKLIRHAGCRTEVMKLTREKFSDKWDALNMKWGFF